MAPHELTRADVSDVDFIDQAELSATGLVNFRSGAGVASTVAATKTVNLVAGALLVHGDDPVEPADKIILTGCAAAGTYTVATVVDDVTLTVAEAIADSTGGAAAFRYVPGAQRVGFNPTGLVNITAQTIQAALVQVDGAISGGGLTEAAHKVLRQLIHLADGGGPFEGFASGAYCETTPAGNPFPTAVIWYTAADKAHKIVELTMTYNSNKTIATEVWKVYSAADVLLATVSDAVAYSGVFETSRTRTIA